MVEAARNSDIIMKQTIKKTINPLLKHSISLPIHKKSSNLLGDVC
jgi:hypothetical protein